MEARRVLAQQGEVAGERPLFSAAMPSRARDLRVDLVLAAGDLPWDLVLTGAGLSAGAMLCGVSGLAFAIGVYLPFATMAPLFVGGCVRALVETLAKWNHAGAAMAVPCRIG